MAEAPGSRAGTMFGPYRLNRPLGRGGMGEVYEAEHTVKGWKVAVKLMSEDVSSDPVFRERMKREARIAGRLQEPHVVPIHDYGEIDGQLFLEMRLIEGTDLDALLKRFGPLTPPRAVAIITQIASALDAAHTAGVMHRDVKPPNILITRDDFAYLVDFGIASANTDEKLTKKGVAVGTWKYMAPERFTNKEVTYRADIYALACVLYECLTGGPPYNSNSAGVLVSAHMMDPIPQPSAVRSGIPRAFDDVIACGMAKAPDDRYLSAGDLALAAHEALSTPDRDRAADIVRRSRKSVLPGPVVERRTVHHPRAPYPPPRGSGPSPGRIARSSPPPARPDWGPPSGPIPAADRLAPQNLQPNAWDRTPPGPPAPQPLVGAGGWNQPAPPAPPKTRNPWRMVAVVAAVLLVVILAGLGIWLATRDNNDIPTNPKSTTTTRTTSRATTPTPTVTSTTTASPTVPSLDAVNKLMGLLPSGYPAGSCTPQTQPMQGALVSVKCGPNADTNGPNISVYGLYADLAGLNNAFTKFTKTFSPQNCPGSTSSPGKWSHTKDPNTILGQVACGVYEGTEPQVMWTNEQTLVFAVVGGKTSGQTLDQIYTWWTTHS